MIILRYLLFPFSILYGWITSIRNFLFDKGILKSYSFDIPIIAVGNLSVGGTGKTPQIEYLIRLLSSNYKIATLSRGYKRKSEGFVLADSNSNAEILGDEPFQIHQKFPNIHVAVDAQRKNGIEQLLKLDSKPEVILLDDAFQHRKVKAGFYILLSSFDDLYFNDFMLPTGNLRESRSGAKRANVIIITKCPKDLSEFAQQNIIKKIGLNVPIFFSFIDYDSEVYNEFESKKVEEIIDVDKLLLAGIAKPEPFFAYLQVEKNVKLVYPDHHHFSEKDIEEIKNKANNKLIITTEKDYVRLKNQNLKSLFYLPIKSSFISKGDDFNQTILNYVGTSTRNR
ncbi:tetraacyldisaccharide 4'-kinase [Flavobacterium sp.]|uniref:tetraacyldisaccharide 4'-kinase n=1 Tax=Flavobacterium sp. TaxID=239 RepID=UPI00262DA0B4|nr:tetraacyldisaccharide 4'-kinase [Flavobacterium sp.]